MNNQLKIAVRANLVFDAPPSDLSPAEAVLACLNQRAKVPRSEKELHQHLEALRGRIGGESLVGRANAKGIDLRLLRMTNPYVREFGLCTFDLDGVSLSVDIFNAADELGLGEGCGRNIVEVFRVDGRDVGPLVRLAREAFDTTDCTFLFGGVSFYFEMFIKLFQEAQQDRRVPIFPWAFLWPLTSVLSNTPSDSLASLPVHARFTSSRGTVLQVFEDLWTGDEKAYKTAADALGLRSFWAAGK